ncbi:hypothetical protein NMY22_g8053 [Coprinellus aureogranulatus]|nr:hypothetical protein NMY22_g8053 [Coprinellus aureogranulatus]
MSVITPRKPLNVDLICKSWREISNSCPEFRNFLIVHLYPPYLSDANLMKLKELASTPSTGPDTDDWVGPPLELVIEVCGHNSENEFVPPPQILGLPRILQPLSKRIWTLVLTGVAPSHLAILGDDCFPTLEVLSLSMGDFVLSVREPSYNVSAFKNAPLRKLSMQRIYLNFATTGRMPIPWSRLRAFDEIWAPDYMFDERVYRLDTQFLSRCTNLESLSVYLSLWDSRPRDKDPDEYCPITIPRLKTLSISLYNLIERESRLRSIPDFEIYYAFDFPSLVSLALLSSPQTSFDIVCHVVPPSKITENLVNYTLGSVGLEWCPPGFAMYVMRKLLKQMSNLQTLTLHEHACLGLLFPNDDSMNSEYSLVDLVLDKGSPDEVLLPKLEILALEYSGVDEKSGAFLEKLVDTLPEFLEHMRRQSDLGLRARLHSVGLWLFDSDIKEDQEARVFQSLSDMCLANDTGAVCLTSEKIKVGGAPRQPWV